MVQNLIEVETRFHVSQEARKALTLHAGDCRQIRFKDFYFCQQLALSDKWLRRRDLQWELKIPVEVPSIAQRGAVVYKELVGNAALDYLVQHGFQTEGMDTYANITTLRSIWSLHKTVPWGSYEMQITADECSGDNGFSYQIGEIEVLVNDSEQVDGASKAIEQTCQQFKLDKVASGGGKLIRYLLEKNPDLYKKLEAKGIT
ncbi:unnamed protein product [Agarophyton chilense]